MVSLKLQIIESCASTNDEVKRLAYLPEGTAVLARRQTAGRGRQGRVWESGAGNMMLSLLLKPQRPAAEWASLSLVAGIALHQALQEVVSGAALFIKWPNDILSGRAKLAGMLLETIGDAVVLGVGVNIATHPEHIEYPATSLRIELAPEVLAERFFGRLVPLYARWQAQGFAGLQAEWLSRALPKGERIQVRIGANRTEGVVGGLKPDGTFLLRDGAGSLIEVNVGDIYPLD